MEGRSSGRPTKYDQVVWFGMKLSPEDRVKIRSLAKRRGITASALVLELVEQAILEERGQKRHDARAIRAMQSAERAAVLRAAVKKAAAAIEEGEYEIVEDASDLIDY